MFKPKRSLRLASTVGLSTLLLWTTMMPVASQQVPQPPSRDRILQGLDAAIPTRLTASEGDILDVENAVYYSDPDLLSLALIPLHPSSPSLDRMPELIRGEVEAVPFGSLYLEGDWPGIPDLQAGTYALKLTRDGTITAVPAEDPDEEIVCGCWSTEPIEPFPVFSAVARRGILSSFGVIPLSHPVVRSAGVPTEEMAIWPAIAAISTAVMAGVYVYETFFKPERDVCR